MLAIDWSHTKGLTIYDGKKVSVVDRKSLLKRLVGESKESIKSNYSFSPASDGAGKESNQAVQSIDMLNSPAPLVILEQGCPLSLIYDILKTGSQVKVISNRATQDYRVEHGIEKSDEADAKIIYELATNGATLTPVSLEDSQVQLVDLYQRYKRYQKARVAMMNMKKGYIRQFGMGNLRAELKSTVRFNPSRGERESRLGIKSINPFNLSPPATGGEGESIYNIQSTIPFTPSPSDGTLPYDIGIDTLKAAENSCLKKIVKLAPPVPQSLKIRGLGPRLWAGIIITANPANFPRMASYLRYCGLVDKEQLGTKWNRHACMLYHMLAEGVMKQRDERFRPIYDKCKEDIASNHSDYTKLHIHNAALNRTATFLAKEIWARQRFK